MPDQGKKHVWLVQQGVWGMPKESMPLAAGYLKAMALNDDVIAREADIRIFNFGGGVSIGAMAETMFSGSIPDVIAFSVLGWNYRSFGALAETFRQLNPDGWVVFGGNHVANQAPRVFRMYPEVDVVVNGEGEISFGELLRAYLADGNRHELGVVGGISYRRQDGSVATTRAQDRIMALDLVPSPVLSGAVDMLDAKRRFRYDVALMETNRGCPYSCAFCYWGGAIGQKVRQFSRDRLREELEFFARHQVPTIVLCDANFGMLPSDLTFVEDVIRTKEKYGFPKTIETSWAKNKSRTFYEIVRLMKRHGLRSSFTLALQTLDHNVLSLMKRRNMKINDWEELVNWLLEEGLDCYAELIWGAPGETYESFVRGYDSVACYTSRIAVYPLLILPNTDYDVRHKEHGLITVRGDLDDFEYVIGHRDVSIAENTRVHRFLFWVRAIGENMFFRHIWSPLRVMAGLSQSEILTSMADWYEDSEDPIAEPLKASEVQLVDAALVAKTVRYLYGQPGIVKLFEQWWRERIVPRLPPECRDFLSEVFRYDQITRPIFDENGPPPGLGLVELDGLAYYCRENITFDYDVPAAMKQLKGGASRHVAPRPTTASLYYRTGFWEVADSHEVATHFSAFTLDELTRSAVVEPTRVAAQ